MVLNHRIPREFIENKVKYIGLIIMLIISSMSIVGFTDSTDSIITTASKFSVNNNCEDGNFVLKNKIDNITLSKLKNIGVDIEENFYGDCKTDTGQIIRVYRKRKNINKISLLDGEELKSSKDILLDDKVGELNGYKNGDSITIENKKYNIIGHAVVPDYTFIKKEISDTTNDAKKFGIAFVSEDDFKNVKNKIYSYSFKSQGVPIDDIKSIVQKNTELNSFIKAADNPRVTGYYDDLKINKYIGIFIGVLLCGLIGFIISMMIISIIDKESPIIGAMYSLGYVKSEILRHFMTLPTVIVAVGACIGTILGFILQGPLGKASAGVYSFPNIKTSYSIFVFFMGIILPMIIVMVVNYFILSKHLSSTPLQLLRNEKKERKSRAVNIRCFKFITRFRITQVIREINSNIMLFAGVSFALFILLFGLGTYTALSGAEESVKNDVRVDYTYLLKMPIGIKESKTVEKSNIKGLSIFFAPLDSNMDVTLQGLKKNSIFYDFNIGDNDDGAYISSNVANKFNFKVGDYINLKDTEENKVYNVKVGGIVDYNIGLYIFMNIEQMNKLMDKDASTYNAFLSKRKLDINEDYVYSTITSEDVISGAMNTSKIMLPMELMVIVIATILFILIIYLLLKLMIDKSIVGISLIKIFGFNNKELSKLYIGSGLYTIVLSLLTAPVLTFILSKIWPNLISNMETYMPMKIQGVYYVFVVATALISYFISAFFLKKHINSISLSEALKNRN